MKLIIFLVLIAVIAIHGWWTGEDKLGEAFAAEEQYDYSVFLNNGLRIFVAAVVILCLAQESHDSGATTNPPKAVSKPESKKHVQHVQPRSTTPNPHKTLHKKESAH